MISCLRYDEKVVINVIRSSYGKNIDRELVKEICEKLDFIPIMDDDLGDY